MNDLKDLKISKELLSEVLGIRTILMGPIIEPGNNIGYLVYGSQNTLEEVRRNHKQINIYEFAFKCKEWIVAQGYGIRTETYDYMEDDSFSGTYWHIIKLRAKNYKDKGCPNCGANASEIEAIIQACEYILKELNENK